MNEVEASQNLLTNTGALLRELRQEAGLTQREAGKLAESTQARISDLENGKADVHLLTLQRWAQVFGYNLEVHFVPINNESTTEELGET